MLGQGKNWRTQLRSATGVKTTTRNIIDYDSYIFLTHYPVLVIIRLWISLHVEKEDRLHILDKAN